jgi:hypothetical protein
MADLDCFLERRALVLQGLRFAKVRKFESPQQNGKHKTLHEDFQAAKMHATQETSCSLPRFSYKVETTIPTSDLFPHPIGTSIVSIMNTQN